MFSRSEPEFERPTIKLNTDYIPEQDDNQDPDHKNYQSLKADMAYTIKANKSESKSTQKIQVKKLPNSNLLITYDVNTLRSRKKTADPRTANSIKYLPKLKHARNKMYSRNQALKYVKRYPIYP